jgi:hypothetical protein
LHPERNDIAIASGGRFLGGEAGRRATDSGAGSAFDPKEMPIMRLHFKWILLIAGLLAAPSALFAQEGNTYEQPLSPFTGPLSNPRPESGGFYTGIDFVYYKTNRQLASQVIAVRGFEDIDGSITGTPGVFYGSGAPALNSGEVAGTGNYQPGYNLYLGYRFQGGIAVELSWKHFQAANYEAQASILPPTTSNVGLSLQNTFLFAPVSNFSNEFAGNDINVQGGHVGSTFGIWNAASYMQLNLTQAIDVYQINVRVPIWDTDNYRTYGLIGPRIAVLQDKFAWLTIDSDTNGNSTPDTQATFTNTVTNSMYGVHFGFGHEWYLGSTPAGAFSLTFEFEGAIYADLVKASFDWDRGDGLFSVGRVRNASAIVPGVEARIGLDWYPWEAIKVHLGYEVMTFFNTMASRNPVDFNMGSNNPELNNVLFRWIYGMSFGVTFSF